MRMKNDPSDGKFRIEDYDIDSCETGFLLRAEKLPKKTVFGVLNSSEKKFSMVCKFNNKGEQ